MVMLQKDEQKKTENKRQMIMFRRKTERKKTDNKKDLHLGGGGGK